MNEEQVAVIVRKVMGESKEKPVREVDEKMDLAAQAFRVMDPAAELTIGDLRTQLEAKLGSETTALKEAVKEVRKLQDRWLSLPTLDAGSWEDWWARIRRDFALFPVQEVLGLINTPRPPVNRWRRAGK